MRHLVFKVRLVAEKKSLFWSADLKFHFFMISITIHLLSKNYLGSVLKLTQIGLMDFKVLVLVLYCILLYL